MLGSGVIASGWSELDDLVEAIEVPDSRWALGVQWHPEVDPRSRIVRSFVAEAAGVRSAALAALNCEQTVSRASSRGAAVVSLGACGAT